ncbi:MAG: hypothetical protein KIT16_10455 [Rhodospirillaceae bacterium]|nr:hypothetical protein [Rhodospirillaceae bacterium]
MPLPSPELAEKLAGYLVDRRDKRLITFVVLAAYLAAVVYTLIGGSFGLAASKPVLDSLETLAMVVVVAHIAGGVVQRGVAQRAVARAETGPRSAPLVPAPAPTPPSAPAGSAP